jgi:chemotaxis signal transduction protein
MSELDLSERARVFRAELDRSFASPRVFERTPLTGLLSIRVGDAPYALPIDEIDALVADRPITRLPSPVRDLIGLCALRGAILPVYDLAPLLGLNAARAAAPRWLVLAKRREPVALAFDVFEEQVYVAASEIAAATGDRPDRAVTIRGALRPLIQIASVLDAIEQRVRP